MTKGNLTSAAARETQAVAESIILDPRYHDVLAILKSARNGAVYGTKVRFPHALVYGLPARPSGDSSIIEELADNSTGGGV